MDNQSTANPFPNGASEVFHGNKMIKINNEWVDKNLINLKKMLNNNPIIIREIKDCKKISDLKKLPLRSLLDLPLEWIKFILEN